MEVSGQLHVPVALPPGKEAPIIIWIGGWVGPKANVGTVKRKNPCPVSN